MAISDLLQLPFVQLLVEFYTRYFNKLGGGRQFSGIDHVKIVNS